MTPSPSSGPRGTPRSRPAEAILAPPQETPIYLVDNDDAIVQVLVALLHHDSAPETAIAQPRLHVEPDLLSLEPGLHATTFSGLPGIPEQIQQWEAQSLFFGGVHLVRHYDNGRLEAAGDPRRGGVGRTLGG